MIIGKKNIDGLVWFIGLRQNGITFFVNNYDDDNHTILWTANKCNGIFFRNERSVHRFINKHLKARRDIFLIQSSPI